MKRVVFIAADKTRELELARALKSGTDRHSKIHFTIELKSAPRTGADLLCVFGVKSLDILKQFPGTPFLYFDKGYKRPSSYVRVAYNGHQPSVDVLTRDYPSDRHRALKLEVARWRGEVSGSIVFAGASEKYHRFYGLPHPTVYAKSIIAELKRYTHRQIVYRPKPSWKEAQPVSGALFSGPAEPIAQVLEHAYALVTHGSGAVWEAMHLGVPCITLGPAVAAPISTHDLREVEYPLLGDRQPLLNALAYCQWTLAEYADGSAWDRIRQWL